MDLICTEVGGHEVDIGGGTRIQSKCVLLAMGAKYRPLDADPEGRYVGRGVYYSATNLERVACSDDEVAVVGAGNSAGQAAVFMAERSRHVHLIVRGDDLRKSMSSYLASRIERSAKISVLLNSEIRSLSGDECVEAIEIENKKTGESRRAPARGVFVMIGAAPNTDWLPRSVERDAKGFVRTGLSLLKGGAWKYDRPPFLLETSCAGVFAAGDVRSDSVKRVASAVGEGSMAVALVHQFMGL